MPTAAGAQRWVSVAAFGAWVCACQAPQFVPPTVTPTPGAAGSVQATPYATVATSVWPAQTVEPTPTTVPSPTPAATRTPRPSPTAPPSSQPIATSPPPAPTSVVVPISSSGACAGEHAGGQFKDVVVFAGARCSISGGVVTGNIRVEENGELRLSDTNVEGNVSGTGVFRVWIDTSAVAGNVSIREAYGFAAIEDSTILGNVDLLANAVAVLRQSRVAGSVDARDNRYQDIQGNEVSGGIR